VGQLAEGPAWSESREGTGRLAALQTGPTPPLPVLCRANRDAVHRGNSFLFGCCILKSQTGKGSHLPGPIIDFRVGNGFFPVTLTCW